MRFGQQYWSMIIKQAMEADGKEPDPSDQELEGSPIAGENHRSPCSSAPPIEGRVKFSDKQKENKKKCDQRHRENKKLQEVGIMNELKSLEEISGELDRQNDRLKRKRDHLEVNVEEENRRILSQLLGNIAGQNTEININGESSMGLNNEREMNEVPITSSTFSRENPLSMNPRTLPKSTKKKVIEASKRIEILKEKIVQFHKDNAVFSAEARLLQKTLALLGNISAQMTSISTTKNAMLEMFFNNYMLQNLGQGSTIPVNTQLPFEMTPDNTFGTGEAGLPVHHPPVYQSGDPAMESLGLPQSHVLQGLAHENQGLELIDDLTFSPSDLLCFDNKEARELETTSS
ncbi:hypothetical protein H0E87_024079 [Populus deltoides]|uniref:BZIP domain-containing protein n=2 Tax=Populus deltoides TaxID=3696 RepID=A0A8T2X8C0_POPDE|nr:hypothetical protein H0E87_024079 [Populus deltoides]